MFYAKRLKYLREKNKMTQKELAEKLELDRSTIANIENDRITPTLKTLQLVLDLFNVPISFFFETNEKNYSINFVPKTWTDREYCLAYLKSHEVIVNNLNIYKLSDDDLSSLYNEMQHLINLATYKYKK